MMYRSYAWNVSLFPSRFDLVGNAELDSDLVVRFIGALVLMDPVVGISIHSDNTVGGSGGNPVLSSNNVSRFSFLLIFIAFFFFHFFCFRSPFIELRRFA
jgi:hypothetical protein